VTSLLSSPLLLTFAQQLHLSWFWTWRKRASHRYLLLKKTKYPFFDEDCILDFDEASYPVEKKSLENNPDIEFKGELDKECLKTIYYGIWKSNYYSPKIVLDIHTSLNQAGITELRKPWPSFSSFRKNRNKSSYNSSHKGAQILRTPSFSLNSCLLWQSRSRSTRWEGSGGLPGRILFRWRGKFLVAFFCPIEAKE
jgi:hypothetical protein